jgi:CBS domain-containing protein
MTPDRTIAEFTADLPLIALGPNDRVTAAVAAMKEHRSDCVLVCEGDELRGIFTQRDFLCRVAVVGESDGALRDVMTADPDVMRPQDPMMVGLRRMAVGNYRNIPVVDDAGMAVANLSVWEVMRFVTEAFASGDLAELGQTPLEKLSPRPAVEIETTDRLLNTLNLMVQRACGAVRVNEGDRLAGIFAERDLMYRVDYSTTAWHTTPISAVMTPEPTCIDRRATVADALEQMSEHGFRHMPIVGHSPEENPTLVSVRDILAFVASRHPDR